MIHSHARTVSIVRFLQSVKQTRKTPGRVPRQQQPDAIRLEYFNAINRMAVAPVQASARGIHTDILQLLIRERQEQGKMDVARSKQALDLIDKAAAHAARQTNARDLQEAAERFGKRTDDFNRAQLDRQLRSAIGVPITAVEKPIRDLIPTFAKQNTELIKTVPDRYWDRLAKDVQEAFESGMHPETLAQRFVELDNIAENDARRIARDQIGKLNAQFNQERQQGMGVEEYTWRTARDNRVRDEHADRDGQRFRWDDPPDDGNPGEPIQCRCFPEPVLDDILAALD